MVKGSGINRLLVRLFYALLFCVPVVGCSGGSGKCAETEKVQDFPYAEIPLAIRNNPESAREYLLENFWDRYISKAGKDTSLLSIEENVLEKAYAEYLRLLLTENNAEKQAALQRQLIAKADSFAVAGKRQLLMNFLKFSELYLYNPNSPYLDEELYIPVLESVMNSEALDTLSKVPYAYQLELALLNRVGQKANDFPYTYLYGVENGGSQPLVKETTLYATEGKYLLIYFNNPGCMSCNEIKQILEQDVGIAGMIKDGELVILSLYIDGDSERWFSGYRDFPHEWIYAKGEQSLFADNTLYGIRAIPSLYLLDSNKKVLLKDASVGRTLEYLSLLGKEKQQ